MYTDKFASIDALQANIEVFIRENRPKCWKEYVKMVLSEWTLWGPTFALNNLRTLNYMDHDMIWTLNANKNFMIFFNFMYFFINFPISLE